MPFIGEHALEALKLHVVEQKTKEMAYGPYCSIVQSSGMGKSRLLDEFSRTNFLIPVNLRKEGTEGTYDPSILPLVWPITPMFPGFPPPDDAIRNLLTKTGSNDTNTIYSLMLHFLIVLFEETESVITEGLKGARNRSRRITKFREFMTAGQTMSSVGENRRNFYKKIAVIVESVSRIYRLDFMILPFTEDE